MTFEKQVENQMNVIFTKLKRIRMCIARKRIKTYSHLA